MRKFTDEEIAAIRKNIDNGVLYCGIKNGRGQGLIQKHLGYISYRHFGSSAVKNTDKDLKWLATTIFEDCDDIVPAVWSDYHINYIPVDSKYQGVDMSREHPNAFGV